MSGLRLMLRQLPYEHRAFWRNPPAAFFTFVFPLIFLVIFNLVFGNNVVDVRGTSAPASTFYVPAIAAFAIVNACFTGLANTLVVSRDLGVLKRLRVTPLPTWSFLLARVLYLMLVALALVAVTTAFGAVFYAVEVPWRTMPAALLTVAVGAAACSALGFAVTAIVRSADAAPAVINAIVLPLLFISDVFIPSSQAPRWLTLAADIFPIRHLSIAMLTAFDPEATGSGAAWMQLVVVAAWGVVGAAIAMRTFRWEPRN